MLALIVAAALMAAPASAPPATPAAPVKVIGAVDPIAAAKPDKVVCRSDQHTGTRLSSRTCHTEREWHELEFQSGEWLRQQHGLPCTTGSAACGPT